MRLGPRNKAIPVNTSPRISIGIPIYNGEGTIRASIEALLAQSHPDFELIVADNASTDATGEIVQAIAAEDPRIRYVRHPTNIGANSNYSYVARVARGEYLKWASGSDWCAPTFLEKCLAALERDPTAVLAAPRTRLFVGDPSTAWDYPDDVEILGDTASVRLRQLDQRLRLNNAFNGLIRMSALRRTALVPPYRQADMVLMGHLALLGKYLLVDEPLFYRRMEPGTATALQDEEAILRHHYPVQSARILFQAWKRHAGWFRAALTSGLPLGERLSVLEFVAHQAYWDRRALATDLGGALRFRRGRTG